VIIAEVPLMGRDVERLELGLTTPTPPVDKYVEVAPDTTVV
jgi:hypothetical protein